MLNLHSGEMWAPPSGEEMAFMAEHHGESLQGVYWLVQWTAGVCDKVLRTRRQVLTRTNDEPTPRKVSRQHLLRDH